MAHLPPTFSVHPEIASALADGFPIVALESTVVTHGLPYPENLKLAQEMEMEVRTGGAVPATIAVLDGCIHIGLESTALERLAGREAFRKISTRDIGPAVQGGASGGTTVAATIFIARKAGILVMATGGIGGVHRGPAYDISADLPQLARTPILLVCAGAKAILDLPGTLEYLETWGIPVIGYGTDRFPAFYARDSGLPLSVYSDSVREIVGIARSHWELGLQSAILVVVPPPEEFAMPPEQVQAAVNRALMEAEAAGIRGQEVTPFLLNRVSELTERASLNANLELLKNNARVASAISTILYA
jgi:pseudouridylate synthase